MATIKIHDKADELRVEILGKFTGGCVKDVAGAWRKVLEENCHRKFTVDISALTGYETEGKLLLREMCQHGTQFAAATPRSLGFLSEISVPIRRHRVTLVMESKAENNPSAASSKPVQKVEQINRGRAMAAGSA